MVADECIELAEHDIKRLPACSFSRIIGCVWIEGIVNIFAFEASAVGPVAFSIARYFSTILGTTSTLF